MSSSQINYQIIPPTGKSGTWTVVVKDGTFTTNAVTFNTAVSGGSDPTTRSLWEAISAATNDPHIRAAMLMGAALETNRLDAPFPDQYSGGPGRGPYQIEAGPGGSHEYEISEDDARDPVLATRFMLPAYRSAAKTVSDFTSDPATAFATVAYRAERPHDMYKPERVARAWTLITPILAGSQSAPTVRIFATPSPVPQGTPIGFTIVIDPGDYTVDSLNAVVEFPSLGKNDVASIKVIENGAPTEDPIRFVIGPQGTVDHLSFVARSAPWNGQGVRISLSLTPKSVGDFVVLTRVFTQAGGETRESKLGNAGRVIEKILGPSEDKQVPTGEIVGTADAVAASPTDAIFRLHVVGVPQDYLSLESYHIDELRISAPAGAVILREAVLSADGETLAQEAARPGCFAATAAHQGDAVYLAAAGIEEASAASKALGLVADLCELPEAAKTITDAINQAYIVNGISVPAADSLVLTDIKLLPSQDINVLVWMRRASAVDEPWAIRASIQGAHSGCVGISCSTFDLPRRDLDLRLDLTSKERSTVAATATVAAPITEIRELATSSQDDYFVVSWQFKDINDLTSLVKDGSRRYTSASYNVARGNIQIPGMEIRGVYPLDGWAITDPNYAKATAEGLRAGGCVIVGLVPLGGKVCGAVLGAPIRQYERAEADALAKAHTSGELVSGASLGDGTIGNRLSFLVWAHSDHPKVEARTIQTQLRYTSTLQSTFHFPNGLPAPDADGIRRPQGPNSINGAGATTSALFTIDGKVMLSTAPATEPQGTPPLWLRVDGVSGEVLNRPADRSGFLTSALGGLTLGSRSMSELSPRLGVGAPETGPAQLGRIMIGSHSPVRLLITDELGRGIGTDELGIEHQEIENASMAFVGHEEFFDLPSDHKYAVQVQGTGNGEYSVDITRTDPETQQVDSLFVANVSTKPGHRDDLVVSSDWSHLVLTTAGETARTIQTGSSHAIGSGIAVSTSLEQIIASSGRILIGTASPVSTLSESDAGAGPNGFGGFVGGLLVPARPGFISISLTTLTDVPPPTGSLAFLRLADRSWKVLGDPSVLGLAYAVPANESITIAVFSPRPAAFRLVNWTLLDTVVLVEVENSGDVLGISHVTARTFGSQGPIADVALRVQPHSSASVQVPLGLITRQEVVSLSVADESTSAIVLDRVPPAGRCPREQSLKSTEGRVASTLRFVNHWASAADIYWLDYDGNRIWYATVPPNASFAQSTYLSHPWVVIGANNVCLTVAKSTGLDQTVEISEQMPDASSGSRAVPFVNSMVVVVALVWLALVFRRRR